MPGLEPTGVDDNLYHDPRAPVDARIEDLLGRMTLAEKIAQLRTVWTNKSDFFDDDFCFDAGKAADCFPHGIGQIARPSDHCGPISPRLKPGRDAVETVRLVNAAQKWAVEETRLGIPILFHEESLHGYQAQDATSFPQAIGLASSWDPGLIEDVHELIAGEIRSRGVHVALSPVVDVCRDPRWGRVEETYGEDPFLAAELGCAAVRGLQGSSLPLGGGRVFATLKHMAGHGQPENGTNIGPAQISERALRENFLPPFEEVIKRTNVSLVMASYNEIDGVPSHANPWLLNEVLRNEWGFDGVVVSDYWAIEQLADIHHVEADYAGAAVRALNSGVDVDLPDGISFATLEQSFEDGTVSEERIDCSVRRVLKIKFEAGLFENPYADATLADAATGNEAGRALALRAARATPTLLKNDGVLPLEKTACGKLAVIGPNAAVTRIGGYPGQPRQTVSLLDGIRAKLGDECEVLYAEGVRITEDDDWWIDEVTLVDAAANHPRIKEAVDVAAQADLVVLALGDTEQTSREAWDPGHLGDRASLRLPGQQEELADAIFDLGKPVVVVLFNGRPPAVADILERADAVLEAWYLGQETGTAMADILFGSVNPGGKLPISFAHSAGALPVYYNAKPSARREYVFEEVKPLLPFGFGLSYTTFDIGAPELSNDSMPADGTVDVSVDVTNTGKVAGDEVVQLYVRDRVSSVTRPLRELRGFRRVSLQPGECSTITFAITPPSLWFFDKDMVRRVEPGEFEIMVGNSSDNTQSVTLTVT